MKAKKMFNTDVLLGLAFILTFISGLRLHLGHEGRIAIGEAGCWFHIISGAAMLLLGIMHFSHHRKWYSNRPGGAKSVGVLVTDVLLLAVAATGIILLFAHPHGFGHWHYVLGLAMTVFCIIHLAFRLGRLRKGLRAVYSTKGKKSLKG